MMSEEEKKYLKHDFFNADVHLSKHRRDENTESRMLVILGQDKAKNKDQISKSKNLMPIFKGDVWYSHDNQFLRLARREVTYRYTGVELSETDNKIDGMDIQNLMALVRKHKEERHVSKNVPIGGRNANF